MQLRFILKTFILLFWLSAGSTVFAQQTATLSDVDVPAEFPGGRHAMTQWIAENLSIPESLNDVFPSHLNSSFTVEADGRLTEIRIHHSGSEEVNRYLAGLVKSMPRWIPAQKNGQPVRSDYHLSVIVCRK